MSAPDRPQPLSNGALRWGILATGGIAHAMTRDLLLHGHRVTAVGSRGQGRAQSFADEFAIPRAHGSYDDLVADPNVDIVYIATPHNLHAANALAAIEHGKHVLVEKAFTLNAAQANTVMEAAQRRGLVAMEAMWTRFLPHMAYIRSVIATGRLGEVRSLHADHTQKLTADPTHRLNSRTLAGGALLDLGVYPIAFAHDILGAPNEITATGTLTETGVDESVATIMTHPGGSVSTTYSSMRTRGPNTATILGTEGRIDINAVWYTPAAVTVHDGTGATVESFEQHVSGRGMQYQAAEMERLITAGETNSPLMPAVGSVDVMTTMDVIRASIGVRYPDE